MSNVSHTLANWELSFQHFSSSQHALLNDDGSCLLLKRWNDSSQLTGACEISASTNDSHRARHLQEGLREKLACCKCDAYP